MYMYIRKMCARRSLILCRVRFGDLLFESQTRPTFPIVRELYRHEKEMRLMTFSRVGKRWINCNYPWKGIFTEKLRYARRARNSVLLDNEKMGKEENYYLLISCQVVYSVLRKWKSHVNDIIFGSSRFMGFNMKRISLVNVIRSCPLRVIDSSVNTRRWTNVRSRKVTHGNGAAINWVLRRGRGEETWLAGTEELGTSSMGAPKWIVGKAPKALGRSEVSERTR